MNRIVANCAAFSSRSLLSGKTAKASRSPTFWNEVRFVFKPIQYALHQMKQPARHQCSYAPINLQLQRLEKDVIVYKYNNPKYYKILNIFGLLQFVFLAGTAEFEFTQLIDLPVNEDASSNKDLPWYQRINLGSNKMRYTMAFICGLAGVVTLGIVWMYTMRSVRYLILRKGGNTISVVTYGPIGRNRILTVPLKCVKGVDPRNSAKEVLLLKVQKVPLYYMVNNKKGEFTNPELFDYAINVNRHF